MKASNMEYFQIALGVRKSKKDPHKFISIIIPLLKVGEVLQIARGEICPIPGVSSELLGVINQRGRLLWILNLTELLHLHDPSTMIKPQQKLTIVVLTSGTKSIGCVVSKLQGTVILDNNNLQPIKDKYSYIIAKTKLTTKSSLFLLNIDAIFKALLNSISYAQPNSMVTL